METYEFAQATTAIYSFFLYDFCDVYLEVTKPIFCNAEHAKAAQVCLSDCLFVCLSVCLCIVYTKLIFCSAGNAKAAQVCAFV